MYVCEYVCIHNVYMYIRIDVHISIYVCTYMRTDTTRNMSWGSLFCRGANIRKQA